MRDCVLIDGANLAYRVSYIHKHLTTATGKPTGVIYGFLRLLNDVASKLKSTEYDVIVCWEGDLDEVCDDHVKSWRKQIAKSYKANREITPEKLAVQKQVRQLPAILDILGYRQISVTGLEADDLIGILSRMLEEDPTVSSVKILSNDKDLFQLVSDKISVIRPEGNHKLAVYKPSTVKKRFGIAHTKWAAYKALTGDKTDNYKGVVGVGDVAAARLITLGAHPKRSWAKQPDEVKTQFKKLENLWHQARTCWTLAYIPRRADFKHFSELSKKSIDIQLPLVIKKRRRKFTRDEYKKSLRAFTKVCAKYELVSFIADRRRFYGNAKVVS